MQSAGLRQQQQASAAYVAALRPLLFDEAPALAASSCFKDQPRTSLSGSLLKQRQTAVVAQLQALKDSVPVHWGSAVAVRVDAGDTDHLRVCVLGPEGTPYEGGAHVFDLHLGPRFPDAPPAVSYRNGALHGWRSNPNLYANGVVCLSLLGTWAGPGWEPGKSTLLQLGLVLNSAPYFNEPGYEGTAGSASGRAASDAYNVGVRQGTLAHCVAAPLAAICGAAAAGGCARAGGGAAASAPAPAPSAGCTAAEKALFEPFAPLLREHFARKAEALRLRCREWGGPAAPKVLDLIARLPSAAPNTPPPMAPRRG